MKRKLKIIYHQSALCLLMLLTACSIPATYPATATQIPFHTATYGPLPTNTLEIRPSPSPFPTWPSTPTLTPSPFATPRSTPTRTPQGTLSSRQIQATSTAQAEAIIKTFKSECNQVSNLDLLSPKGNWLAISCGYNHDQSLEIISKNGQHWMLPIENYMPDWILEDGKLTGLGGLYPLEWSLDEEYLFFSSNIGFSGGGTCFFGIGSGGLFRFDVSSGKTTAVLPLEGIGYEFSFSPNHRYLAYESGKIAIYDLETSHTTIINTEHVDKGKLTWSPDGSRLAYATCKETEDGLDIAYSSIKIYTLSSKETITLLERPSSQIEIEHSDDDRVLNIFWNDYSMDQEGYVYYDWYQDQFITTTPTPSW